MRYTGFHYETIDSTNEEAKRLVNAGGISGNCPSYVIADTQTAGKGTQGRQWVSPIGAGLYLSVIHQPKTDEPLTLTHHYTQAAGLACLLTFKSLFGLTIELKPINDLYALCPVSGQYKKLGGILTESMIQENQIQALITGIGINLSEVERAISNPHHPEILPISLQELIAPGAYQQLQQKHARQELVETLINQLDKQYQRVLSNHLTDLEAEYQQHQIKIPV